MWMELFLIASISQHITKLVAQFKALQTLTSALLRILYMHPTELHVHVNEHDHRLYHKVHI